MSLNLIIVSLCFIIALMLCIIYILKKGKISIKYGIVWLFATMILFLFIIFPGFFSWFTRLLGFNVGSNMIFAGLIAILIFINIILTIIVSGLNEKTRLLIQEGSILKRKINDYEKK